MSTHSLPLRVYYEDTDSGGVVYYANYLKFMERARTEWLRDLGFEQDALMRDIGIIFAVRSVSLDYRKPARFNDLLQVSSAVSHVRGASIGFVQQVRRKEDVLCEGSVIIASLDYSTFRPRPVPRPILDRLQAVLEESP